MILYRHIRLDKNEVFYVGIGKDISRAYSKLRSRFWKIITDKTDYRVEILFDDIATWEEACEKEKEFIKLYGRKDIGTGTLVNLTDGGDGSINRISTKKILLDPFTGIFYSVKEVSQMTGYKLSYLYQMFSGQKNNKTIFIEV